ncbi:hypothetical protein ACES2I_17005 [Bdellovibrio bacteriovorus]|uniref:hypothetical protein n=1 Tax=Bdellovibrio bacteriovorus TaxID=959 RepID=UPI0035A72D82
MKRNKLLIALLYLVVQTAEAQQSQAKKGPKKKVVKVQFDDELVKGGIALPDMSSINSKKDFNFKRLIRVRENFVPEMENGINDFKGN